MQIIAKPTTTLNGSVTIPGSKSQAGRGLLLATLAAGTSTLRNVPDCDDSQAAIALCRRLGAQVNMSGTTVKITSGGIPLKGNADKLYSGNSGITTRFFLPALGLREPDNKVILDCGEQMKQRPLAPLVNALQEAGMRIVSQANDNRPPLTVCGKLQGGKFAVSGITSQYVSALLLNLPCAPLDSVVTVEDLHERPYVEMTLGWLTEQGIAYRHEQNGRDDIFHITGGQRYHVFEKTIAGDFSSASYFLAAGGLLGGEVTVNGLDANDPQADRKLVDILKRMGADLTEHDNSITLRGGKKLQGIRIDARDIPDLLPTLAVIGTQAAGVTEITNVPQARLKETDRIRSMAEGLRRMGADVQELSDGFVVSRSELRGAAVRGYDDHRTVMALALAGMLASGTTTIDTAQAINKTFPDYVMYMQKLGGKLSLEI